jgi:hypothetical protein
LKFGLEELALERLEIYGERLEVESDIYSSDIYLNFLPLTYPATDANIGSSAVGLAKHHDHLVHFAGSPVRLGVKP